MKCQDVEHILIETGQKGSGPEERSQIEEHLQDCPRCASLKDDLDTIRGALTHIPSASLPEELDTKTSHLCRERLGQIQKHKKERHAAPPLAIWILFAFLLSLTAYLTIPLFKNLESEQSLSVQMIVILAIMIQNVVMLFFAPVLFKKFSRRQRPQHLMAHGYQ